jgi:hypothetical protein
VECVRGARRQVFQRILRGRGIWARLMRYVEARVRFFWMTCNWVTVSIICWKEAQNVGWDRWEIDWKEQGCWKYKISMDTRAGVVSACTRD